MQAIILAAGMGNRLGDYTKGNTKCMVKVGGERLIDRMLKVCHAVNIARIILVVGYQAENLKNHIGDNYQGIPVIYIENEDYYKTNNIYSLYMAKELLVEDDTLLFESDIIFDERLIFKMLNDSRPDLAAVSLYKAWMDGTAVTIDDNDNILSFISKKEIDFFNLFRFYKTVNIYKFSKDFSLNIYVPFLKAYSESLGKNEYYEQVLRVIASLERKLLKAFRVPDDIIWYEIDNSHDLANAEILFAVKEEKIALINQRFGGYWRFPGLKDYCYLVNPYFPCQQLLNEMQYYFTELIAEYPSSLAMQSKLASNMFGCRENQLVVGNGASELIDALFRTFVSDKKIGLPRPTFDEYPSRISSHSFVPFYPQGGKIHYGLNHLLKFMQQVDVLVLINPDNPSGNYLPAKDVLILAQKMLAESKLLIVDESFIDFSHEGPQASLLRASVLDKFKNLVVIKSISKSYGVPGIRLGVLGTADESLIDQIKAILPIWNINSLGEFFLQSFKKYESDYYVACKKISRERDRFYHLLTQLQELEVYPSEANYFLCKVKSRLTALELSVKLLEDYNILIKVCSQKNGLDGKEFIRIAVRNTEDNDYFVDCWRRLFL